MSDAALAELTQETQDTQAPLTRRTHKLTPTLQHAILERIENGEPYYTIAKDFGVHETTIGRLAKQYCPTVALAKRKVAALAGSAVSEMGKLLRHKDANLIYKASAKLMEANGLAGEPKGMSLGVQVVIGAPSQPAVDARAVTVTVAQPGEKHQ
jgi:hypothetical protein